MDSRESNRKPERSDEVVLRTFALSIGIVLAAIGTVGLTTDFIWNGAAAHGVAPSVGASASVAALLVGAALTYWGIKRWRAERVLSEEALSQLVEKYEREGNARKLADARERLIQLLIDKDEQNNRQEPT
jgi:membrane protein implicated in regulation of membrane protease activity